MYMFIATGQDKFHATKIEITSLNDYHEEKTTNGYLFDNGLVLVELVKTEFIFVENIDMVWLLASLQKVIEVYKTNQSFCFDHSFLLSLVVLNLEEINKDCLVKTKVTELLLGVD